jgi:hypothetical protein
MKIPNDIVEFFGRQSFVIVTSVDKTNGRLYNSCKGVVRIDPQGRVYLLDLYLHRTYNNLNADHRVSITAVDEHSFAGYCLQGAARTLLREDADADIVKEWEQQITSRISQRLVRNLRGEKGHGGHPEAKLPQPRYIIVMDVEEVIDLTPEHLKA